MFLGSNLTNTLGCASGWAHYDAPGDLCVKSDMDSDYEISDTTSSSVALTTCITPLYYGLFIKISQIIPKLLKKSLNTLTHGISTFELLIFEIAF